MRVLLLLVALFWIAAGASLILNTAPTRDAAARLLDPARLKGIALIPLVLGVFLVLGAFTLDRLFWWSFLIGAAALAKGVYLVRISPERAAAIAALWLREPEERTLRLWGVVALVLGTVLLTRLAG
ncbi:MAG: hypothetical protein SCH98_04755 [Deferrisomatales bacterium]|nr:hypothetical protein [Deferrisomatales bacterium]